jgi:hypothetical protein
MSPEIGVKIKDAIQEGLYEDFEPKISIQSLSVSPNYEKGFWKIELVGYCPTIKETISLSEKLRRLTT